METKQKNENIVIWITFALVVIVAGIIIAFKGFDVGLDFSPNTTIRFSIEEEKVEQAKEVIEETFYYKSINIKETEGDTNLKVEVKTFAEEEKENIINNLNENLKIEITDKDIKVEQNAQIKLKDVLSDYIKAITISTIVVLIYLMIKYRKHGVWKVFSETIASLVMSQTLTVSVLAISRYKIDITIIAVLVTVYICALYALTNEYEKKKQ